MSGPTKSKATEAARSFLRHKDRLGVWTKADLLMDLGRLYEFPPGTPDFGATPTVASIAEFILAHAVDIE